MKLQHIIFTLFISIALHQQLQATHVTGAELSYRNLGSGKMEVSLTIYRDVFGLVPFDPVATLYLVNSSNNLVDSFPIPFMGSDTLPVPTTTNLCNLIGAPKLHLESGYYKDTLDFNVITDNSMLVYHRCCLPLWVSNLVNSGTSGSAGLVVTAKFNNSSLAKQNSSPVFKGLPSEFHCLSFPYHFDHSANDLDGDVLTYELFTPPTVNSGHLFGIPPPYAKNTYLPGYSMDDILGNQSRLKIDSLTGIMSSGPVTSIGAFVYGVSVNEYRGNDHIGLTERVFVISVLIGDSAYQAPIGVVENEEGSELITIFPNPVDNELYVEFPKNHSHTELNITNSSGQIIVKQEFENQQKISLSTSVFSTGCYYISIKSDNGTFHRKFIKL